MKDKKEDVVVEDKVSDKETVSKDNKSSIQDNKKVVEEQDPLVKKNMGLKKGLFIVLFFSIIIIGFLLYLKTNIEITSSTIISVMSFSILFNLIILIVLFATGMGKEITGRVKRRILFGTGKFVNVLYVSKNGPIREFFCPVDKDTGLFKILNGSYARNPSLLHHYKKIPTYIHREGTPDPLNVFEDKYAGGLSNSELDIVMSSKEAFDFKEWLKNNALYVFLGLLIIVAAAAISAYFGFSSMQMLRDGTYHAVQCIEPVVEIVANAGF